MRRTAIVVIAASMVIPLLTGLNLTIAQIAQLSDALPSALDISADLRIVDEGSRSAREITDSFPDPGDAAARFAEWGWLESSFRTFAPVELPNSDEIAWLEISLHRFANPEGASSALPYFVEGRAETLGLQVQPLGSLMGSVPGGWEITQYEQQGAVFARITSVGTSPVQGFLVPTARSVIRQRLAALQLEDGGPAGNEESDSAAAVAVELSRLEESGNFDDLYDRMHPDARAIIPREAVVGWHQNEFAPRGPMVATVESVVIEPWTWGVNGKTYENTASVSYQQRFEDGTEDSSVVHLVRDESGDWGWFFGGTRSWVDEQIATYPGESPQIGTGEEPEDVALEGRVGAIEGQLTELGTAVAALESEANSGRDLQTEVAALSSAVADLQSRVATLEAQPVIDATQDIQSTELPATETPTLTPTHTPSPSPTHTPSPTPSPTNTPSPTPTSTPTPSPTPTATFTPIPTPTVEVIGEYQRLEDVRELDVRPQSMVAAKIRFHGVVHTTDGINVDINGQNLETSMGIVVQGGDSIHYSIAVIDNDPSVEIGEGAEVEVFGTFLGKTSRENDNGVVVPILLVEADQVILVQPGPDEGAYVEYFQPAPESIDERLDDLRLAGQHIEFTCQVFNLVSAGTLDGAGDNSDGAYTTVLQVHVLAPDAILLGGSLGTGETFTIVSDLDSAGIFDESWLRVRGTVIDRDSYYNIDNVILSAPLVRAEQIEVLPGPPPGFDDLLD